MSNEQKTRLGCLVPENPGVVLGITTIESCSEDGIGTRKILFDREGSGFLGSAHRG